MTYKVDSAVIMAAGVGRRFAPLSQEIPKSLLKVRGEILLERQIQQLQEANIPQIVLVVGYQKEKFAYLAEKMGVILVENPDYATANNPLSLLSAKKYLNNSYICSCDNYFSQNPFTAEVEDSYYAAVYAAGETKEWCLNYDSADNITGVKIGGCDAWIMLGHCFWSENFSHKILGYLEKEKELYHEVWEKTYIKYLANLPMKIRRYQPGIIHEFDSIKELSEFDDYYEKYLS